MPGGLRIGPVGVVVRARACGAAGAVVVALLGAVAAGLFTGSLGMPADRVVAALAGDGTRIENLVVLDHRLARTLTAVLVGFALGCSGGLTQSVTRNPLASPDILGVTAGAGFFAVLLATRPGVAAAVGDTPASGVLAPAALLGGLVTTACVLALSWRSGFDGLRVVLVGLSVNALALAGTSWLLTRADLEEAQVATRWLTGSLASVRMPDAALMGPLVLLGALVCLRLSRDLGALRLGRDIAPLLGTRPARTEAWALLTAVPLASGATAVAGPVAFVAFVAPQVALRLFRTAGPPPLAGGLVGAFLVLGADLVAQSLPAELPVGIPTAVLGAPYLLFLLNRHRRRTSA